MDSKATELPPKIWQTGYTRALYDFEWLARPDVEGQFFRTEETLSAYANQLKPLEKRFQIFAALSFLGASIILAGGIPSDLQIDVFGVEIPAELITLQLLAVFVSVCFIQSFRGLGCYMVLLGITNKLLDVVPVGAEFVVAKYDASHLWANVLKRRSIGYRSPWHHSLANGLFSTSGLPPKRVRKASRRRWEKRTSARISAPQVPTSRLCGNIYGSLC